jgi:hypothetical protein
MVIPNKGRRLARTPDSALSYPFCSLVVAQHLSPVSKPSVNIPQPVSQPLATIHQTASYESPVDRFEDTSSNLRWPVTNCKHANHAISWGNTTRSPQLCFSFYHIGNLHKISKWGIATKAVFLSKPLLQMMKSQNWPEFSRHRMRFYMVLRVTKPTYPFW